MKRWVTLGILASTLVLGGCEETTEHVESIDTSRFLVDTEELDGEPMESIDESGEPSGESVESADEPSEPGDEGVESGPDDTVTYDVGLMDLPSADDLPLGEDYIELNNNIPTFTNDELEQDEPYFSLSALDHLGRVGVADALLDEELMPAEGHERGGLGHVTPSGWNQNQRGDEVADMVSGGWLYNRAHLIGHQMAGDETDVAENLMTGTRQFNVNMIPFENFVADVVEGGTQVRYRVTPVFEDDNLLSHGVIMEGFSLDEEGELGDELTFNIFVPNEQDGIVLDYSTGMWDVDGDVLENAPSDTPSTDDEAPVESRDTSSALQLINEGSSDALQQVNGIGPAYAARIITYRETHGAFSTLETIKQVSGIGQVVHEELKQNH